MAGESEGEGERGLTRATRQSCTEPPAGTEFWREFWRRYILLTHDWTNAALPAEERQERPASIGGDQQIDQGDRQQELQPNRAVWSIRPGAGPAQPG